MLTAPAIGAFRLPLAAAGVALLAGHAGAWTLSKASTCQTIGTYEYGHQVSIATGDTVQNAYMTVVGKWQPSPTVTTVTIDTFGKGKVTVQRLCATDPWATGGTCTGNKVTQQTNPGWGLANVLSAAKDALAPKGLLPPPPAKVPVPLILSEKWGGGGLPIAISVSVTGPHCARRYDEVRRPDGSSRTFGPTVIPANGKFQITQAIFHGDLRHPLAHLPLVRNQLAAGRLEQLVPIPLRHEVRREEASWQHEADTTTAAQALSDAPARLPC